LATPGGPRVSSVRTTVNGCPESCSASKLTRLGGNTNGWGKTEGCRTYAGPEGPAYVLTAETSRGS
jgi:hypothetical protein